MPLAAIGLGIGLVGGVGKLIQAGKANHTLDSLVNQDPRYAANPLAAQRLSLAQMLLNSRMPGAAYVERNILGNQSGQQANVERNATSGSQALAMEAAGQGQTNSAFEQLNAQEGQDYQRRFGNLVGAQEGMIQEGDKVYQSQKGNFQDLAQIRGAQNANTANAWSSLSNAGFGLANFGLAGGVKKLFGGNNNPPPNTPSGMTGGYGGS